MAFTIIEVERKTGVASRTLRFWADKGLFLLCKRIAMACGILARKMCSGCFG